MSYVAHLKGPAKEGQRDEIFFPTKTDFVEGLETIAGSGANVVPATDTSTGVVKLYSTLGTNDDGTMTQLAIKNAINEGKSVTKLIAGASNSTVNAATTNGNTYLRLFDDNTVRNSIKIAGSGAVTVSSDSSGNITVGSVLQGTLTLSSSSVTVARRQQMTVTASGNSSGAISAVSNNTSIATASVSGSTVTITGVVAGSATITVSQAGDTTYAAPASKTISVTVSAYSATLNENTWTQISTISKNGQGDLYWDIGDAKEITLSGKVGSQLTLTNTKLCVFILDFNHAMNGTDENNIIWGGFKSALTSGKYVALIDDKYNTSLTDGTICFNMNHWGNYNYGGWKGSDLRYDVLGATSTQPSGYGAAKTASCVGYDATATTLTSPKADTLLSALPSDLRNVIRLWTRWVDAVGNSSNVDANIKTTVDAITLLAEQEIFGSRSYANQYEANHNTQMTYYKNGNSRVRYKHNDLSSAVWWWASSPYYYSNSLFCNVNTIGSANNNNANNSNALAPDFKKLGYKQ